MLQLCHFITLQENVDRTLRKLHTITSIQRYGKTFTEHSHNVLGTFSQRYLAIWERTSLPLHAAVVPDMTSIPSDVSSPQVRRATKTEIKPLLLGSSRGTDRSFSVSTFRL